MPKTKFQRMIFGILMSITMAYGMEVFNVASFMWIFVFLFSSLWGNRIGHGLAAKIIDAKKDNPFFCTLVISGCTVLIMCPTMSAVAAILFNIILGGAPAAQFPAIWIGTVLKNFPMALLWNLFAAGPLTRFVFRRLFAEKTPAAAREEI